MYRRTNGYTNTVVEQHENLHPHPSSSHVAIFQPSQSSYRHTCLATCLSFFIILFNILSFLLLQTNVHFEDYVLYSFILIFFTIYFHHSMLLARDMAIDNDDDDVDDALRGQWTLVSRCTTLLSCLIVSDHVDDVCQFAKNDNHHCHFN